MKFELTEKEVQAYEKFIARLPKKYKSMSREITFSTGSGIGVGVTIKVGDKVKDITDYDSW